MFYPHVCSTCWLTHVLSTSARVLKAVTFLSPALLSATRWQWDWNCAIVRPLPKRTQSESSVTWKNKYVYVAFDFFTLQYIFWFSNNRRTVTLSNHQRIKIYQLFRFFFRLTSYRESQLGWPLGKRVVNQSEILHKTVLFVFLCPSHCFYSFKFFPFSNLTVLLCLR